jgi:hypothetical protein
MISSFLKWKLVVGACVLFANCKSEEPPLIEAIYPEVAQRSVTYKVEATLANKVDITFTDAEGNAAQHVLAKVPLADTSSWARTINADSGSTVILKTVITEGDSNSLISGRIEVDGKKFRSGSAQGRAGMVNIGGRLP